MAIVQWRNSGDFAIGGLASKLRSFSAVSKADDLQNRTTLFAIEVIKFCRTIARSVETDRITLQLVKSVTSVGANYRAARRARSHAEFTAKIGVVAEEADECEYWLCLIDALSLGDPERTESLHQESKELMKIFGKSAGTARSHRQLGDG